MAEDKNVKVQANRTPGELTEGTLEPVVDIIENENELVLLAEVPGAGKDDASVKVDKGVLIVEAEAKVPPLGENYSPTYLGFEPGRFFRAFALSDEIDREKITASVSKGVLTVHLPKAEKAKSRKIEIKSLD